MSAIRMKVKPAEGDYDLGASKFLGKPTFPKKLANESLPESVMFFLQIRLEDIKDLDKENMLPHTGYLYFFIDTADGLYGLKPIVRYYDEEPTHVLDDFNEEVPGFEEYTEDYLIEFAEAEDSETGSKLLGVPADWNYQDEPARLLFQFDPLDSEMGIFDQLDGLLYFFFGEDKRDFSKVTLKEEFS